MRVKLLGASVTLTATPSLIGTSSIDLLIAHDAGGTTSRTVTLYRNDGTTVIGSYLSSPGTFLVIHKGPDEKLKVDAGTDVKATPVSYIS
jgi:hypothetical protein